MAVLEFCRCGAAFSMSADSSQHQCDDCSGVNAAKRAEAERWQNLPLEAKVEELKARLDSVEQRQSWDGRIG